MKTQRVIDVLLLSALICLGSCKKDTKENTLQPLGQLTTTARLSFTDNQINEGIATALDAADGTEDGSSDIRPVNCADIVLNSYLKTITIDFGGGCVNPITGRLRSGRITVGYNGDTYTTSTERTISFENFRFEDTLSMNGTFTQSNITRGNNKVNFSLSTTDFVFGFPGGRTQNLSGYNRNFIVDLGKDTRDISDNIVTVSGDMNGVNEEGEPYSVTITNPVVFNGACAAGHIFYPVSGAYDVRVGGKSKFNVSWGNGNCDKLVTISYPGNTIDVALK
ncbi:MAG: hypothetical protein QM764_22995 [Chitinophagaceae bacterium]